MPRKESAMTVKPGVRGRRTSSSGAAGPHGIVAAAAAAAAAAEDDAVVSVAETSEAVGGGVRSAGSGDVGCRRLCMRGH